MAEIKTLLCDIETFSSENLSKCGAYRYSEATDFEILLFGYCVNDGPVTVIDLASGEKISHEIIAAIKNPNVTKYAHNSSFERIWRNNWDCFWNAGNLCYYFSIRLGHDYYAGSASSGIFGLFGNWNLLRLVSSPESLKSEPNRCIAVRITPIYDFTIYH